ncbi:Gldg family protein [Enterococcus sp. LJL120]
MKKKNKLFANKGPKRSLKEVLHLFSWQSIKKSFQTKNFKQGTYRGGLTVLVIVLVMLVNLIANQLPASVQTIDLSEEQIMEVSTTSENFLDNLSDEIDFVVLANQSETDTTISTFIEKYASLSKNISVEWIDPTLHPSALTEYSADEDTLVIIDQTTGESMTVSFSEILYSGYDSSYNTVTTFDGDGAITSALNALTSNEAQVIYTTEGHGETDLPTSITDAFSKNNYATNTVNTLMTGELPTDADLLLIYGPTTDFTTDEITQMEDYIAAGGKVMVVLSAENPDLPNLSSFMEAYGLAETAGYVADTERSYQGQPYYLFPNLTLSGTYAEGIENEMVLILNTKGFTEVDPTIENVTVTSLMETSSGGYDVTEDDQVQGTYLLGAVATQTVTTEDEEATTDSTSDATTESTSESTSESTAESTTESSTESTESSDATEDAEAEEVSDGMLTVVSSTNMMDDSILASISTIENSTLFMNMVTANFADVSNISIEAKTLSSNTNTVTNPGSYSLFMILIIPLVILIVGFAIWLRRRKA